MTRSFQESPGSFAWKIRQQEMRAARLERERVRAGVLEDAQTRTRAAEAGEAEHEGTT